METQKKNEYMALLRKTFGNKYPVFSDIYIDKEGIHDGFVNYYWQDIKSGSIGESDPEEMKKYFGDDYDDRPFAIFLTKKDGSKHTITLFGQGWDKTIEIAKAINHYSGQSLISLKELEGKPIPLYVILCIALVVALMIISIFI